MKSFAKSLKLSWEYTKLIEWSRLIFLTGTVQVIVQVLSFISGIIIIRLLPTQEYALYTLANTMLGTITMLGDSGISNGILAEAGKVWQDKKKLGIVMATGLFLRKRFGIISFSLTSPLLIILLLDNGASWLSVILITLSLIPAFFAALSDTFLEMAPRLHQAISPLQKNVIEVSIGRFLLSGLLVFLFPFTFVALIANGLPRIYGNIKLKILSSRYVSEYEKPDPVIQKTVMHSVKRTLPIVIYHSISGQITFWIISILGTTAFIAHLGALGRVSMIFTLVSVLFTTLIIPRFARMEDTQNKLLKTYLLIQVLTLFIGLAIIFSIWIFSNHILWVFGNNYYGLNKELVLLAIAGSISLLNGICSQLVISRGWFLQPHFLIGTYFIGTVIFVAFFDPSTLINNLYYGIAVSLVAYFIMFVYGLNRLLRVKQLHN